MSTIYWVYQCNGTRGTATVTLSNPPQVYPTCTPASQGGWFQVETQVTAPFDPATADRDTLYSAFASGLVVGGIGLTVALSIAIIIRKVRDAW